GLCALLFACFSKNNTPEFRFVDEKQAKETFEKLTYRNCTFWMTDDCFNAYNNAHDYELTSENVHIVAVAPSSNGLITNVLLHTEIVEPNEIYALGRRPVNVDKRVFTGNPKGASSKWLAEKLKDRYGTAGAEDNNTSEEIEDDQRNKYLNEIPELPSSSGSSSAKDNNKPETIGKGRRSETRSSSGSVVTSGASITGQKPSSSALASSSSSSSSPSPSPIQPQPPIAPMAMQQHKPQALVPPPAQPQDQPQDQLIGLAQPPASSSSPPPAQLPPQLPPPIAQQSYDTHESGSENVPNFNPIFQYNSAKGLFEKLKQLTVSNNCTIWITNDCLEEYKKQSDIKLCIVAFAPNLENPTDFLLHTKMLQTRYNLGHLTKQQVEFDQNAFNYNNSANDFSEWIAKNLENNYRQKAIQLAPPPGLLVPPPMTAAVPGQPNRSNASSSSLKNDERESDEKKAKKEAEKRIQELIGLNVSSIRTVGNVENKDPENLSYVISEDETMLIICPAIELMTDLEYAVDHLRSMVKKSKSYYPFNSFLIAPLPVCKECPIVEYSQNKWNDIKLANDEKRILTWKQFKERKLENFEYFLEKDGNWSDRWLTYGEAMNMEKDDWDKILDKKKKEKEARDKVIETIGKSHNLKDYCERREGRRTQLLQELLQAIDKKEKYDTVILPKFKECIIAFYDFNGSNYELSEWSKILRELMYDERTKRLNQMMRDLARGAKEVKTVTGQNMREQVETVRPKMFWETVDGGALYRTYIADILMNDEGLNLSKKDYIPGQETLQRCTAALNLRRFEPTDVLHILGTASQTNGCESMNTDHATLDEQIFDHSQGPTQNFESLSGTIKREIMYEDGKLKDFDTAKPLIDKLAALGVIECVDDPESSKDIGRWVPTDEYYNDYVRMDDNQDPLACSSEDYTNMKYAFYSNGYIQPDTLNEAGELKLMEAIASAPCSYMSQDNESNDGKQKFIQNFAAAFSYQDSSVIQHDDKNPLTFTPQQIMMNLMWIYPQYDNIIKDAIRQSANNPGKKIVMVHMPGIGQSAFGNPKGLTELALILAIIVNINKLTGSNIIFQRESIGLLDPGPAQGLYNTLNANQEFLKYLPEDAKKAFGEFSKFSPLIKERAIAFGFLDASGNYTAPKPAPQPQAFPYGQYQQPQFGQQPQQFQPFQPQQAYQGSQGFNGNMSAYPQQQQQQFSQQPPLPGGLFNPEYKVPQPQPSFQVFNVNRSAYPQQGNNFFGPPQQQLQFPQQQQPPQPFQPFQPVTQFQPVPPQQPGFQAGQGVSKQAITLFIPRWSEKGKNYYSISNTATNAEVGKCYKTSTREKSEIKIFYNGDFNEENYLIRFVCGPKSFDCTGPQFHYSDNNGFTKFLEPKSLRCNADIKTTKNGHQYREIIDIASGKVAGKYYIKERILQFNKQIDFATQQPIIQM
ncbi:MAG: hypothetical protein ACI4PJ_01805, partial [Acutalibacteraceae bacterium]